MRWWCRYAFKNERKVLHLLFSSMFYFLCLKILFSFTLNEICESLIHVVCVSFTTHCVNIWNAKATTKRTRCRIFQSVKCKKDWLQFGFFVYNGPSNNGFFFFFRHSMFVISLLHFISLQQRNSNESNIFKLLLL